MRQGQLDNNWRDSLRTRELLRKVAKDMEEHNKKQYFILVKDLHDMVVDRDVQETPKINAALLLADLHPSDISLEKAIALLRQTMKKGREARQNASAMRLIQIGGPKEQREAWEYLEKQLRTNPLSVALLLGQLGKNRLEQLSIKQYVEGGVDQIVNLLEQGKKRNEYHKRYAELVVQCLKSEEDKSSCP